MTAHVDLRDTAAVRRAIQVDLLVAESLTHYIQIVDRDLGGVLGEVRAAFESRATRANRRNAEQVGIEAAGCIGLGEFGTGQGRRLAGATQIDEH